MKLESKKYRMNLQKVSVLTLLGLSINGFATVAQAEGVKAPASAPTPLTAAPKAASSNDSSNSLSALEAQWQAKHQALKTVLFDRKERYSDLPKDKQAAYVLQAQENLDFAEMHFGRNSKQVLQSLIDLASVMPKNNRDETTKARTLLLMAFERWEKYFGQDVQLFEDILNAPINNLNDLSVVARRYANPDDKTASAFQQVINSRIISDVSYKEKIESDHFRHTLYTRGLAVLEKNFGVNDKVVVNYFEYLANFYVHIQKDSAYTKEAQDFYQRVIALLEKKPQVHPKSFANILNCFAHFNEKQQNLSEAAKLYLREIAIREQYLPNQVLELNSAMVALIKVYEYQQQYIQAIFVAQKLLTLAEKTGEQYPFEEPALNRLARLHLLQKNYREARELYLKKLATLEGKTDNNSEREVLSTLGQLAEVNKLMHQYDLAETLQLKRMVITEKNAQKYNGNYLYQSQFINCLKDLAQLYLEKKDVQKANAIYQRAEAVYFRLLDVPETTNQRHINLTLSGLSSLYVDMKQYDKAEAMALRALAMLEKNPADGLSLAFARMDLGSIYQAKRQFDQAEAAYLAALKIYDDSEMKLSLPPDLFKMLTFGVQQKITSRLLSLYQQTNQPEKAQALKAKYQV